MLNVFMGTVVSEGRVHILDIANYLGFGENGTRGHIVAVECSEPLEAGSQAAASLDRILDEREAKWLTKRGVGYVKLRLAKPAEVERLTIWTDRFPDTFRVYVVPGSRQAGLERAQVSEWEKKAEGEGWLAVSVKGRKYPEGSSDRTKVEDVRDPYELSLAGKKGDCVVVVWDDAPTLAVREFEVTVTPRNPTPFAFAGVWLDQETGLYCHGARYRLPSMGGKFISPDPLGFIGGPNLYAYAHNDPLTWHDPDGEIAHVIIGAAAGGALGGGFYLFRVWLTDEEFNWAKLGIYAGAGAASGALAAATFGASAALTAGMGWSATATVVTGGAAAGAVGGATQGFISSGGVTYLETGDVRASLTTGGKAALTQGALGALGGAAGGAVLSQTGASFWGFVGSGAAGGGVSGGVAGGIEGYRQTGTFAGTARGAAGGAAQGAVVGGAIGAAGWGAGRLGGQIRPLPEQPEGIPDPRSKGVLVRTEPVRGNYGDTEVRLGFARHHIKPLSLGGTDTPDNIVKVPLGTHQQAHPGAEVNEAPLGTLFY
jgi:RHS repeat-associated protein